MNQFIIFNDNVVWHAAEQEFVLTAMTTFGAVTCRIRRQRLHSIQHITALTDDELLASFECCRDEIEELLSQRIGEQDFSEDGSVCLY